MTNMNTMTVVTSGGECVQASFPLNKSRMRGFAHNNFAEPVKRLSTIRDCVRAVAEAHNMDADALYDRDKSREIAHPRQMAWMLARAVTGKTYHVIARSFGADHSTVMYGIKTCADRLDSSEALMAMYNGLLREFTMKTPAAMPGKARRHN